MLIKAPERMGYNERRVEKHCSRILLSMPHTLHSQKMPERRPFALYRW